MDLTSNSNQIVLPSFLVIKVENAVYFIITVRAKFIPIWIVIFIHKKLVSSAESAFLFGLDIPILVLEIFSSRSSDQLIDLQVYSVIEAEFNFV